MLTDGGREAFSGENFGDPVHAVFWGALGQSRAPQLCFDIYLKEEVHWSEVRRKWRTFNDPVVFLRRPNSSDRRKIRH